MSTLVFMKSPVFRIESMGEEAVCCPSLAAATQDPPDHPESFVATSVDGVRLAEAMPIAGGLRWQLTNEGREVRDAAGWTAGPPTLTSDEYDTVLAIALGEELEKAS